MLLRDGISQILVAISINAMIVLVQFNGRLLIYVVGSKIGNRFSVYFVSHTTAIRTGIHQMRFTAYKMLLLMMD